MKIQSFAAAACLMMSCVQGAVPTEVPADVLDGLALPKTLFVFEEPAQMYLLEIAPLCRGIEADVDNGSKTKQGPRLYMRSELLLARARLEDMRRRFPAWMPDLMSSQLEFVRSKLNGHPVTTP